MTSWTVLFLTITSVPAAGDEPTTAALRDALTFHVSFDADADADFARGDRRIFTTPTGHPRDGQAGLKRSDIVIAKGQGRYGDALRFSKKAKAGIFYRAKKNVDYRKTDWSGTVSFWLSLDPQEDLEPGYCDPIQITDKKWNNACFFVDFTKDDLPRHFRLGAYADHSVWNPKKLPYDSVPPADLPLITVKKPPFRRGKWTHVVFTFSGFNTKGNQAEAKLYMNGQAQGTLTGKPQIFTWDESKAAIILGWSYIGLYDDLAIFNRALSEKEVKALYGLAKGVGALHAKSDLDPSRKIEHLTRALTPCRKQRGVHDHEG